MKNYNKLIDKKKVIENKNIYNELKKLDFDKIYNITFGIINIGLSCYIFSNSNFNSYIYIFGKLYR